MLTGHWEWLVILIVAVLIFGSRLPKVMRSLGRSVVEFKKGVKGVEDDIEERSQSSRDDEESVEKPSPEDMAG